MANLAPTSHNSLHPTIAAELAAVRVGTILYDTDHGDLCKVIKVTATGYATKTYDGQDFDGWEHFVPFSELQSGNHVVLRGTLEEEYQAAEKLLAGLDVADVEPEADGSTTALATRASKAMLQAQIDTLALRKYEIERAAGFLRHRYDSALSHMRTVRSAMIKAMEKMERIIHAFELYLGINEDVIPVRDGPRAPKETPVVLRQMILYMDEEIGDPRSKSGMLDGKDFRDIEDFDEWVAKPQNLQRVLPETKGVVVLRPTRQKRDYGDPFFQAMADDENMMAYLLIRNGEELTRIYTSIKMGQRLFPTEKEMEKLLHDLEKASFDSQREDIENTEYVYRRNALILQGLLDRSNLFEPLPHPINLLKPETYADGSLVLLRDEENILGNGRPSFPKWREQINQKLEVGSRVLVTDSREKYQMGTDGKRSRFTTYYINEWSLPPLPKAGVYQVEKWHGRKHGWLYNDEVKDHMVVRYNPEDEVTFGSGWEYDPHTRKNRVGFIIEKDDNWILNFDQIDVDDIDYYLNSRVDRIHYLQLTQALWDLRDFLRNERKEEEHFVKLVAGRLDVEEELVWDAVNFWKTKNKWKRPINRDSAKALRMIEGWLTKGQRPWLEA